MLNETQISEISLLRDQVADTMFEENQEARRQGWQVRCRAENDAKVYLDVSRQRVLRWSGGCL